MSQLHCTAKMSDRTNETPEITYVLWDILPIGISFIVGICLLIPLCSVVPPKKFQAFGNRLIPWLYGGRIIEVDENNRLQTAVRDQICVKRILLLNAVTLLTLLIMIFFDTFIIRSEYGCLEHIDCYIEDHRYNKTPVKCSDNISQNVNIICYEFNLDFFQAFADAGGILSVAALGVYFLTYALIRCGKTNRIRQINTYMLNAIKIFFLLVASVILWGLFIYTHMSFRRPSTIFRLVGRILKYIAVDLSFSITTLIPWYKLIRQPEPPPEEPRPNEPPAEEPPPEGQNKPERPGAKRNPDTATDSKHKPEKRGSKEEAMTPLLQEVGDH